MAHELKKLNNLVEQRIYAKNLNFCKLLRPRKNGKISIVGQYTPCYGGTYVKLKKEDITRTETSNDFSKYYYGISPRIDGSLLVKAISSLSLCDEMGLTAFIAEHCDDFMLHEKDKKYLLSMAKYFLLSVCSNYGIKIFFDNRADLEYVYNAFPNANEVLFHRGTNNYLSICGCPTRDIISFFSAYKFVKIQEGEDYIWKCAKNADGNNETYSIEKIYEDKENICLVKSDVFYSGVLFRTLQIKQDLRICSNKDILPLIIEFERSTYGTVYSLDNNFLAHPLLQDKDRENIISFFLSDDMAKKQLHDNIQNISCEDDYNQLLLQYVNNYLQNSRNVNQICVAGNLITKDGYLINCLRNYNSIDGGQLYPSINGNAELADKSVEFYQKSVYEDYPSIELQDKRIDFNGELSREAFAELDIRLPEENWDCYGIALLGSMPDRVLNLDEAKSNYFSHRRMHFSLIMEQACEYNFAEIRKRQSIATEKYENKEIYGYKISQYNRISGYLLESLKKIISQIAKMKNVILSVFTVLLFLLAVDSYFESSNSVLAWVSQWNKLLSIIFALAVIIITLWDLYLQLNRHIKIKKYKAKIKVIRKSHAKREEKFLCKVDKLFKNRKIYPITYLLTFCYIFKNFNG